MPDFDAILELSEAIVFTTNLVGLFIITDIVLYILFSFGLYRMGEREGMHNSWLAFIPFAQYYVMGEILTVKLRGDGGLKLLGIYGGTFILAFIFTFVSLIPVIGIPFSILLIFMSLGLSIFSLVLMYWLFDTYSDKAVWMLIAHIVTAGLFGPIAVFAIRNNPNRYETSREAQWGEAGESHWEEA